MRESTSTKQYRFIGPQAFLIRIGTFQLRLLFCHQIVSYFAQLSALAKPGQRLAGGISTTGRATYFDNGRHNASVKNVVSTQLPAVKSPLGDGQWASRLTIWALEGRLRVEACNRVSGMQRQGYTATSRQTDDNIATIS